MLDAPEGPGDDTKFIQDRTGTVSKGKRGGLPARALRWLRWRIQDRLQPVNACRGVYANFAAAAKAAPDIKPVGYDSANASKWYSGKLAAIQPEDYPVAFWLREALRDGRSVFEIGGHVGVAYYGFSRLIEYPAGLTWTICDVPSICEAGAALARERGQSGLRFVTSASQTEGADIVLAAGALQYIESPSLAETIASFRHKPGHVLVNTTPVYDGPDFITLQNIGTAYCPYRVFGRATLLQSMQAIGYSLIDSWRQARTFRLPGHADKSFDHYSGFYFRST